MRCKKKRKYLLLLDPRVTNLRAAPFATGPSKASPTVSYGVCGLASPDSRQKFDTTTPVVFEPPEAEDAVSVVPSLVFLVASLLF